MMIQLELCQAEERGRRSDRACGPFNIRESGPEEEHVRWSTAASLTSHRTWNL